jgi:hypothetical protein
VVLSNYLTYANRQNPHLFQPWLRFTLELLGAQAETLKNYFGNPNLQISVYSPVTNTTHTFDSVREWQTEVEFARIYAGFHYHHSVVQGLVLGHKVAHNVVTNYFRPVR